MKSNFFIILISFFYIEICFSKNLFIEARNISIEKKNEFTVFENDVVVKTEDNYEIKSQYGEYNKKTGILILKDNIKGIDNKKNLIETEFAQYNEISKVLETKGQTKITTSEEYVINGKNIIFDNIKKIIMSDEQALITDKDNNKIYLDKFEYNINQNIFKSIGYVKVEDKSKNVYEFSQIYIDTKRKEILGSDTKLFLNQEDFKINKDNKPRVFANTSKISEEQSIFKKGIFTLCNYRENDKCPPWSIQSSQMLHDNKKKTIYYENAVIKIYDIPIFYLPRFSHPDPSVDRRSGFLPPSFEDTKNLGSGITVPYFFALSKDKNFTLTNKFYVSENPLIIGEYHQAFKNSNFLADFGYTEGFKKTSSKKRPGNKSHFFSEFTKNFETKNDINSSLKVKVQEVSNDKYLKLYKLDSELVDYNKQTLENSIDFTYQEDDLFFGFNSSIYETLKDDYNDKYEYIYPDLTVNKNLFSKNNLGNLDLETNLQVRKYDTNKFTNFLINDFDWNYKFFGENSILNNKFLANFKNINYEVKNVDIYKKDTTSEIFGALGYLSQINFRKNNEGAIHKLTPKILLRYAPGQMRKEESGSRLNPSTAFSMNRLDDEKNFETGLSSTIGFDYKIDKNNRNFDFSIAQIINDEENKKMPTKTSLDEKLSDLVGSSNFKINEKLNIEYNFSVDQNYNDFNYNDFGANINFDPMKIGFNYILENKHVGNQEYIKAKIDYSKGKNGLLSFETKRSLVSDSSEFYNLSYEYINDCLRAGLVYRREFYQDSELEPEDTLMFKITLVPFGNLNSPSMGK